jgi:tRNA isopentenyl-2-thiomethyl-A-37 hydroxylase MiaE
VLIRQLRCLSTMELEAEVLKFIGEYSSMVEEAVEKHVPRRLTHSYLVTHFGEARFKHSPESITEGCQSLSGSSSAEEGNAGDLL